MLKYFCHVCCYFMVMAPLLSSGQKNRSNPIETSNNWYLHHDTVHAFEVEVPGILEENKTVIKPGRIPPGWRIITYSYTDKSTGIFYLISLTEPGNDQYIFNDSLYLVSVRQNQAENLTKRTIDTIWRENGVITYLQEGKSPMGNIYLKSMSTVRQNRVVTVITGYQKAQEKSMDIQRFMQSFRLLDFKKMPLHKNVFGGNAFETYSPVPFHFYLDTLSAEYPIATYNSRDSLSSDMFSAIIVPAANKQWYRNAGDYWEEKLGLMTDEEDTLIAQQPVTNGEAAGYHVILQSARLHKHVRMLPFADSLLILLTVTPPNEVLNENKQQFFDKFRFVGNYPPPALFKSRAGELLNQLASTDSAMYNDALLRMNDAPFSIADIPALRQALLQHYPLASYSTQFSQTPTEKISEALLQLGDPSIASFAMREYTPANGRSWMEQSLLLNLMANDPREETYGFITRQLLTVPKDTVVAEDVLFTLCNDLDVLYDFFADLLPLIENPYMQNGVLAVINNLLQSDSIQPQAFQKYEDTIFNIMESGLEEYKKGPSSEFYNRQYRAMAIAARLKTKKAIELLYQCSQQFRGSLQKMAALELLNLGEKPDARIWDALAANNEFRYDLYHDLAEKDQQEIFPAKYARQNLMAESVMWTYSSEDATPLDIEELTQRKTIIEEGKATVYFFVIHFRTDTGEKSPRLGMVAFPADSKSLKVIDGYYAIDWETPYLPKQKEKMITEMMSWLEE